MLAFFKVTLLFSPCLQAFYVHLCMYVCNDVFIYVMIHIDCLLHPALTSLPFPFATILDQSNHLCVSNEYHIFTASYGFYYYILFSFSFFCYPHCILMGGLSNTKASYLPLKTSETQIINCILYFALHNLAYVSEIYQTINCVFYDLFLLCLSLHLENSALNIL